MVSDADATASRMNTPPSTTSLLKRSISTPTPRFTTIAVR